ncbi:hypothetical protein, partial [Escherichia coli]
TIYKTDKKTYYENNNIVHKIKPSPFTDYFSTQYAGPASDIFLPIEEQYSAVLDSSHRRPKSKEKATNATINNPRTIFFNINTISSSINEFSLQQHL